MSRLDRTPVVVVAGLLATAGFVSALLWSMTAVSYDVWTGVGAAVILLALSTPLLVILAHREADPRIGKLLAIALVAKLVAAGARFFVAFEVYDGRADAAMYIEYGEMLAEQFRSGVFDTEAAGRRGDRFISTPFMRYITGLVFAATGVSGLGGFMVFSWLGFWGIYAFHRAFVRAVPDGNHFRYALLIFFVPSVLYWPSTIGKEAWMLLCLGLGAYGASRILTRASGGYVITALAIGGLVMMRPHIAVVFATALLAGFIYRGRRDRPSLAGPLPQVVGLALLAVVAVFALQETEEFFDVDEQQEAGVTETAEQVLERTEEQTATGGSRFEVRRLTNPIELPRGIVTVMFRPFPNETDNAQALIASFEGLLLMGLFLVSWRRVWTGVKAMWHNPYVRFALVYSLIFIVAYTAIGNFGILARQRVQMFPFVLILLAMPLSMPRLGRRNGRAGRGGSKGAPGDWVDEWAGPAYDDAFAPTVGSPWPRR